MQYKCRNNRWLLVMPGVTLTPQVDPVIARLDAYFGDRAMIRFVTSAYRLKQDQLRIIIDYARRNGYPPHFTTDDVDKQNDMGIYVWADAWTTLLQKGIAVNPPCAAPVLRDYRNTNGVLIHAGTLIPSSAHFSGKAFDISGSRGNQDPAHAKRIDDEVEVVKFAMGRQADLGIRSYTVERLQNCLHINVS
jgi:hypothetical protein